MSNFRKMQKKVGKTIKGEKGMKKQFQKSVKEIPNLTFNSNYFKCPKCGWKHPDPLLVKGPTAHCTPCKNCGHSYLVRID